MDCRLPSIDPRPARAHRARAVVQLAALLALAVAPAAAHEPSRMNAREIVRMAGSFAPPQPDAKVARAVTLSVQGKERTFQATEWQAYALVAEQSDAIAPAPDRLTLQGTREDLARIAGARPEQHVAILAERRPGVGELFVLALDLCPSR